MTAAIVLIAGALVLVSCVTGRQPGDPVTLVVPDPAPVVAEHVGATADWSPMQDLGGQGADWERSERSEWDIMAAFDTIIRELTQTPDWLEGFMARTAQMQAAAAPDPLRAAWEAAGLGPDTAEWPMVPALAGCGRR